MISLPFTISCDGCCEGTFTTPVLVEPMMLSVKKGNEVSVRRFIALEYPEELNGKGWITVEIGLITKTYCPACKEKFANEKEED